MGAQRGRHLGAQKHWSSLAAAVDCVWPEVKEASKRSSIQPFASSTNCPSPVGTDKTAAAAQLAKLEK